MAEQQRIQPPYGDIFMVQTPTLDNVAKQLYAQQQQRLALKVRENQQLDQMIQKDFGRIRSIDTPEVVDKYNKYKALKKQMLFNKQLQKDPLLYNKAQQEANAAWQDMQTTINGSAEIKEFNKNLNPIQLKDPDAFSDDYGQRMSAQMNTPLSQLRNHPVYGDLTNADNYRYKGSNTNFNDIVSKIYDKKNKIVGKEEALDKQGIQFRSPVYEYGTNPSQVYEGLVNSLDHKTERDASYKWKQLTPDVVQKIESDYNAIPQSKWEQMGVSGPQQIDLRGGSDAEKYMRLLAMQNAVNTNPRLVNYENRTSEKAKMDLQYDRQLKLQAIRQADAKALAKFKKDLDPNDTELNNVWYQRYLDNVVEEAKTGERHHVYQTKSGKSLFHYNVGKIDPFLAKSFARNGNEPDRIGVTEGGEIVPIFFERDDKGGIVYKDKDNKKEPLIDNDASKPISYDQALVNIGYRGATKKQLAKDMGIIRPSGGAATKVNKTFSFGGKSYTRKQLNDNGYDDNEIEEFIKAGVIK